MIPVDKPNPFQVLGLPTNVTVKDITDRGKERFELAESEEKELLYRWAIQQLTTHPLTRLEYELFEVPDADYDNEKWDRFARLHGRNPVKIDELLEQSSPPSLDEFDLVALLRLLLDGMLAVPEPDLKAAVDNSPFEPSVGSPPLEICNVIFG